MIIGQARGSDDRQSTQAQIDALTKADLDEIFARNISGGGSNRKELTKVIAPANDGDTLLVRRLDRPAKNTRDLLNSLASISERGATSKSLNDLKPDTTMPTGGRILAVLGRLAEFDREPMKAKTAEGRMRAAERRVPVGRPPRLNQHQRGGGA